jgi:hypothetical protein
MFRNFKFFRAPTTGARKDPPMPDPTPTPAPTTTAPINLSDQVSAQITALTDAMRQLAQSQKTLLESMKPAPTPTPQPAPAPSGTISGDPTGGSSPAALGAIDYSKLSPLQQITLGLRQGAD